MRAAPLVLCLALMGCTQFPALDGAVSPGLANADFPDLVPIDALLVRSAPIVADPVQTTQTLEARVSALRARASALRRGAIVDANTRARLSDARS